MRNWSSSITALVATLLLWACSTSPRPNEPVAGDSTFDSTDPSNWTDDRSENGADGADADGDSDGDGDPSESPEREIEEADIIKVEGDVLYALSAYRGLVIIDVSDPDHLAVLGRHPTYGVPFEMYVREGIAYPIYSSFWSFEYDEAEGTSDWVSTSRIMALDVSDPAEISTIGVYDLAGEISDSRIVGDVLYAVAYENGWCWRCDSAPQTTVTSINLADPSNIYLVERLTYSDEDGGWGRRSIEVNTQRMYVSGYSWDSERSTIQVVDISDPGGDLRAGDQVELAGQIESRWQMNEYDGVLRVVSQPGWGWDGAPVVETFSVESSDELTVLGRLELQLPRPEALMSARFDGDRAYAVTFEQTDPLFLIDLSDPANPQQRGELEIPGWLYHMEPRGDRLYAIGFDDTGDTSLAVSLFDVSDLDHPTQIERVNFGADWGWMVEDQDRIHKAFRFFDDLGLIVMPFAGWEYDDSEDYYYGSYRSGVQLIDFTTDSLALRGVVPHRGFARRAFVHRDRLFAMSDERVETFDISDRDAPDLQDSLVLARNVYRVAQVGDHLAELVSDWWTGEARLDILPLDNADGMTATGSLDLSSLRPEDERSSSWWSYGFSYYDSRMFSHDGYVYLLWSEQTCGWWWDEGCTAEQATGLAVFDVRDPSDPQLLSHSRLDFAFPFQYGWWWSGTVEAGESIAQLGSTLVVRQAPYRYYWWDEEGVDEAPTLEVLDLSDPTAPVHAATFTLPGDAEMGTLQVVGGQLLTSHRQPVEGEAGRVRFYLDRVDLSTPSSPRLLASINIPGSPVSFDEDSGRLVTVDYQTIVVPAASWEECYYGSGYSYSGTSYDDEADLCLRLERSLNLLDVVRDRATLVDRIRFADRGLRDVRVTDSRIFVGTFPDYSSWWYYDDEDEVERVDPRPELITLTGLDSGELVERSSVRMSTPYTWLFAARGDQAIVLSDTPPAIDVYDSSDADDPTWARQSLLSGYGYDVQLIEGGVLSANGMWGVQVVPLAD